MIHILKVNLNLLIQYNELKYKVECSVDSFNELKSIILKKISQTNNLNLQDGEPIVEQFNSDFNEWVICNTLNDILPKSRLRIVQVRTKPGLINIVRLNTLRIT